MSSIDNSTDQSDYDDIINDDELGQVDEIEKLERERDDELEKRVIDEANSANFADALNKILATDVQEGKNPLLERQKPVSTEEKEKRKQKREELLRKMEIPRIGYVKPNPDDMESEKHLRKIATKGVTALFNAISRGKRLLPSIEKENEKRKKKDRINVMDTFNTKIEDSKQKLEESAKVDKKWAVLDDHMIEKNMDLQNWDTKEDNFDDWDEEMDV